MPERSRADASTGQPLPGRAYHYRDTGSPLHRMGAGWKLPLLFAASALAVLADGADELALLLCMMLAGYGWARLSLRDLWQDVRWLAIQGVVIALIYVLRDGAAGLAPAGLVVLRIALFFLPAALALRTTPVRAWIDTIERALPERLAFAVAAGMRFAPYFARELHEIVGGQRLRGARLAPGDLWHPVAWRDWTLCVGVPLALRAIHAANEAAVAAEIRGIAVDEESTT
jgi:energy-coupling factor transporter transmembrane protein EcfT